MILNDDSLIKDMVFRKDAVDGPIISEEEAVRISEEFDFDAALDASSEEQELAEPEPPSTIQRRRFSSPGASSSAAAASPASSAPA